MDHLPRETAGDLCLQSEESAARDREQRMDPLHIGMNVPGCHEGGGFIKIDEIRVVVHDS